MRRNVRLAVVALALAVTACPPAERASDQAQKAATPPPRVVFETSKGRITLEVFPERAPETVDNFLKYVRSGFYDGLVFHRVMKDFVIQAGLLTPSGAERHSTVWPIENEASNDLKNVRGAVGMARGADPHSATSEFFIDVQDNPKLDFRDRTAAGWGYAVFGKVIEGMDVVDSIAAVPVRRSGRFEALPIAPVVIERATIVKDSVTS